MTFTELPKPEDIFTREGVAVGSNLVVTRVDTVVGISADTVVRSVVTIVVGTVTRSVL
jgi:hypothetical protein